MHTSPNFFTIGSHVGPNRMLVLNLTWRPFGSVTNSKSSQSGMIRKLPKPPLRVPLAPSSEPEPFPLPATPTPLQAFQQIIFFWKLGSSGVHFRLLFFFHLVSAPVRCQKPRWTPLKKVKSLLQAYFSQILTKLYLMGTEMTSIKFPFIWYALYKGLTHIIVKNLRKR